MLHAIVSELLSHAAVVSVYTMVDACKSGEAEPAPSATSHPCTYVKPTLWPLLGTFC